MLISCPECNHRISQAATSCPHCGQPLADGELARLTEEKYRKGQRQQIGCLVLFAILGTLCWVAVRSGERSVSPNSAPSGSADRVAADVPVTRQRKVMVFCAYCGNVIRSKAEKVEVPLSESLEPRRTYATCSRRTCQKAARLRGQHRDWPVEVCYIIAQRKVRIGMTAEQARAAWGAPEDVNRTTTPFGTSEQWCYDGSYLYFDDGILTSFQN